MRGKKQNLQVRLFKIPFRLALPSFVAFLLTLAHLIVVKRVVDGDVAFPSYSHRHEDGPGDRHLVERVEEVREEDDMQLRSHVEVLPVKSDRQTGIAAWITNYNDRHLEP